MKIEFDEVNHIYTVDGSKVPNVTQILSDLIPYFNIPEWYLQRGQAVHACAAMIAKGIEFHYDERIAGQVLAIYKFFDEVKPIDLYIEMPVASIQYRFAGRLDLIAEIAGKFCLIDYKSSIEIDRVGLQLAAYSIAAQESKDLKIENGIGVAIREDGSYSMTKMIKLKNYKREFLSMRATYAIRDRMGYHKKKEK